MADENQPPKKSYQRFDEETIKNALIRDGAKIFGEYKSFNRDTYIDFICKCSNIGRKGLRQIVRTGAHCELCKPRKEFNRELLDKYISDSECTLIGSYEVVNSGSDINIRCKCGVEHIKRFQAIVNKGSKALCKNCSKSSGREKADKTMKGKYGQEPMKNKLILDKTKSTCLKKYGVDNPSKCEDIKEKIKKTNLEKYGNACSLHGKEQAEKVKNTMTERYGENPLQNDVIREKKKKTSTERYGVSNPAQNSVVKEKIKATNEITYGGHPLQNEIVMTKLKATVKEKYNVENVMQNEEVKKKMYDTNIERWGTKFPSQLDEIKEKTKETNVKTYGKEHPTQSQVVREKTETTSQIKFGVKCNLMLETNKEKAKITNLEKYGKPNPFQNEEVQKKARNTCLKIYGKEYPNQNQVQMEKTQKNAKKFKKYTFPSGEVRNVQGYEPFALEELISKGYKEEQIKTNRYDVPGIDYELNGKKKTYFPDIYIPHENKIIEVKSGWTYKCKEDNIKQKADATRLKGYNYEIWIYDAKRNKTIV